MPPGIFVIWDGMGLVAKRIEHVPHSEPPKVVLKSLNPEYDSHERLAEEVRLVGRAVWVSKRAVSPRGRWRDSLKQAGAFFGNCSLVVEGNTNGDSLDSALARLSMPSAPRAERNDELAAPPSSSTRDRSPWAAPRPFGCHSTPKCTPARPGTGIPSRFAMERTILPQSVSASCPKA